MSGRLEVVEAGLLTTVQDLGRPAAAAWGVPRGGACDSWSHSVANALVGNEPGTPALELTLVGPVLRASEECLLGLAGADLGAQVVETGARLAPGRSFVLEEGQTLAFGSAGGRAGIRAYLAIAGGFDVPHVLGSASTCLVAGFGGLDGRRLAPGDMLAGSQAPQPSVLPRHWSGGPRPAREATQQPLRVLPGPHAASLPRRLLDHLLSVEYSVSARGDRQAIVLDDPSPSRRTDERLLSLPVAWGAIQLPPDGQPICLLADHQTVGGYPVLAVVISADLPALGQLGPADPVRFRLAQLADAQAALRQRELAWREGVQRLAGRS